MTNLTIQPNFKSRFIKPKSVKRVSQQINSQKPNSPNFEFNKFWNYIDNIVVNNINKLKKAPFSQDSYCRNLEIYLKNNNVNVRFNNNIELAKYIEQGISKLKIKNIPLPTNIIFVTPLINFLGILGLTYMLRSDKKESPIILPKNIASQTNKIKKAYERGEISTPNPLHTFFHEVGHWIHYQKGFNILRNAKFWQKVDTKQIEKEVSKLATKREDGSEFYAEIFAKKMNQ